MRERTKKKIILLLSTKPTATKSFLRSIQNSTESLQAVSHNGASDVREIWISLSHDGTPYVLLSDLYSFVRSFVPSFSTHIRGVYKQEDREWVGETKLKIDVIRCIWVWK
jgi:hypothetical protein